MADPLARNYHVLTPAERFSLALEAMARGDDPEFKRLQDTCPKLLYEHNDAEYRDRLQRAYLIALLACLNLRPHLALIRGTVVFREQHKLYARGPTLVATAAFLYGREYGRWECGAIEQIPMIDPEQTAALIKDRPDLKERIEELGECAAESVLHVADGMKEVVGIGCGVEALSQWEGFGRFCRGHLSVEPLTLLHAYGIDWEDPAAEVLASHPDAKVDEAIAAHWEGNWAREWGRRFEGQK